MKESMKHKAIKRRLMAWLLLVCVLFSGCGIDLRNYIYTEASLKRVAAKSLKEKYGEEFVIYQAWDRSQTMFFVECSPKDDPEVVFKADICKNGDGVVVDGYTQGVIAKELDEILQDDFHELFGDCYTRAVMPSYYNTYPYSRYGAIEGVVDYIDELAVNVEGIGTAYAVFVVLEPGEDIDYKVGLGGSCDIRVSDRTVLEYFLEPIQKGFGESLDEL